MPIPDDEAAEADEHHLLPKASALILLAEIDDAGSVTEAARRLGISQPAVSKQLRRLEQILNAPLFERS
ncbi:MAG: LysR family transcriptional regulator, partial [Rhodoferax sp.]|nr:LysR family transcriptional regulator [Rhodoferax sp.]